MRFLISPNPVLKVATISCTGTMLNTMESVLGHLASVNGVRYKNHGPIRHYLSAVEEGNARITEEHLSQKEQMEEEMFLGLRKKSGVSMARFEKKFGRSFDELYGEVVRDLVQQGLMQIEGDRVRMTKRGLFLGDTVAERFILE